MEALLESWRGFVVVTKLRQRHRQKAFRSHQSWFQLQCLTQRRYGQIEFPLLEVDETEVGVHFRHTGLQGAQFFKVLFRFSVTSVRQSLLPFLCIEIGRASCRERV